LRELPTAPAALRNTAPILGVLIVEFGHVDTVLEIGSGTGQHAVAAAAAMPHLCWQPTDLEERLAGIRARIEANGGDNVLEPLALDVLDACAPGRYGAVFTANTLHIVSEAGVRGLVTAAGRSLRPGGVFCCYGPFRRGGAFSTESNADFDASLRQKGSGMGIRDLDDVVALCSEAGLERTRTWAMPANNLLAAFRKRIA